MNLYGQEEPVLEQTLLMLEEVQDHVTLIVTVHHVLLSAAHLDIVKIIRIMAEEKLH